MAKPMFLSWTQGATDATDQDSIAPPLTKEGTRANGEVIASAGPSLCSSHGPTELSITEELWIPQSTSQREVDTRMGEVIWRDVCHVFTIRFPSRTHETDGELVRPDHSTTESLKATERP